MYLVCVSNVCILVLAFVFLVFLVLAFVFLVFLVLFFPSLFYVTCKHVHNSIISRPPNFFHSQSRKLTNGDGCSLMSFRTVVYRHPGLVSLIFFYPEVSTSTVSSGAVLQKGVGRLWF